MLACWMLNEIPCSLTIVDALDLVVVRKDQEFRLGVRLLNTFRKEWKLIRSFRCQVENEG